jgi:hypothetical protein
MLFTLCSGAFALVLRRANHASLGPAVLLCLVFIQAPEGPIQAQRVLIVAPEDTVSGRASRHGDDRRSLKEATSGYRKGANPNTITPMVDSNAELKRALSSTLGA